MVTHILTAEVIPGATDRTRIKGGSAQEWCHHTARRSDYCWNARTIRRNPAGCQL